MNNKFYVGVHSTNNIEDGYMGSGTLLKKDIIEFGLDVFEREILFVLPEKELAFKKEAEIVDLDFLRNPLTYNLVCGGKNGIRTVKEKAIYFNRDQVESITKEPPFEKYDPEYKTTFYLKNKIEVERITTGDSKLNRIRDLIIDLTIEKQDEFMQWISDCWNNRFTHKFAEQMLNKIIIRQGFYNNIEGREEKWD